MEKLEFKVEPEIYENISAGVQKAFVSNVKPSELHKYLSLQKRIRLMSDISMKLFSLRERIAAHSKSVMQR